MRFNSTDRRLTYLNAVLTINAVVVTALLWTNIVGDPTSAMAFAAPQSSPRPGETLGVPDAGLQQLEIINHLKAIRAELKQLESVVGSGKMKVVVGNLGDIKLDIDYAKLRDAVREKQP